MNLPENTLWWHVYPLGFCGAPIRYADPEPGPRLLRLLPWLDHAVDLGATGLLLGPVFASQTHGYDSLDQYRIDPRLGGDAEFDALVAACRERGLRLVLDGVFSHVGNDHPLVGEALRDGPDSHAAQLIDIDWHASGGPRPRVFEGHGSLARLRHETDATADYVAGVMTHWLDRGADGWRLYAAYSVDPAFWARVLPRVRAHAPEAWFLGEVIHGDYPAFVAASGVDTVTQYELWKAIWSSLRDRNFFELDHALRRHAAMLERFVPQTFVGNHDVTRIASTVGADAALAATAVLLTIGGTPSIYAGDELGMRGIKRERVGGDDAVRPAFPPAPAPDGAAQRILDAHRDLARIRRDRPWLTRAVTETTSLGNTRYVYRARSRDGQQHLDVTLDITSGVRVSVRDGDGRVLWHLGDADFS